MSQNSLDRIHATFNTSSDTIFAIVKDAVDEQGHTITPMHAGYDSEVYGVETTHHSFVLKINHDQNVPFASEAWAMEQARNVGVPVAEVLYCGVHTFRDAEREVMVQSLVDGKKFESVRSHISQEAFEKGLRNMGELLARLHTIEVDGCYHRRADATWYFPTCAALIESAVSARKSDSDLLLQGGLTEDQVAELFRRVDKNTETLSNMPTVLNHGDYLPDHVFVDDDMNITGVIDFGSFEGGPYTHDLAFLTFMGPNIPIQPLFEGYGHGVEDSSEIIRAQALLIAAGHLAHRVQLDMQPEVSFVRDQIERLLGLEGN